MREANKGIESEISRDDCEEIWNGFEMCLLQSQASINTMVNNSSNWLRKLSRAFLKNTLHRLQHTAGSTSLTKIKKFVVKFTFVVDRARDQTIDPCEH